MDDTRGVSLLLASCGVCVARIFLDIGSYVVYYLAYIANNIDAMDSIRMTTTTKIVIATFIGRPKEELSGADITKLTGIQPGSLYPILRRLDAKGVLSSRWENIEPHKEGRPQKRLYKLTEAGSSWAIARAKR